MAARLALALATLAIAQIGLAQTRPIAPTYPILEPNMLQEILRHLDKIQADGSLGRLMDEGNKRAFESVKSPAAVEGVSPAFRARTFHFDPSIVVNEDIVTPDGTLLARKGQRVNPLDQVAWPSVWLFADWRDPAQVREVVARTADPTESVKVILVGGSYIAAAKALQREVFFDQHGLLVRKFGITRTPATIRQEGAQLRIDEFPARSP